MQVIFFFCISTEQKLLLSNENVNIGALREYDMLTYYVIAVMINFSQ